jgi:hypothetical protein
VAAERDDDPVAASAFSGPSFHSEMTGGSGSGATESVVAELTRDWPAAVLAKAR